MADIQIHKGLDIPLTGGPLPILKELQPPPKSLQALDLSSFPSLLVKTLVSVGDFVKSGQPLLKDLEVLGRLFVSSCTGTVVEIRRGEKRRIQAVIIEREEKEEIFDQEGLQWDTKEAILSSLAASGLMLHIGMRPLGIRARHDLPPQRIFIKGLESAPFLPSPEIEFEQAKKEFDKGLELLEKLTPGNVHLIYREGSSLFHPPCLAHLHSAKGPHPIANPSVHIEKIAPIRNSKDIVWTLSLLDVIAIGHFSLHGKPYPTRIVSLAGDGILKEHRHYYKIPVGIAIKDFTENRLQTDTDVCLISGDPLTGRETTLGGFLGYGHLCLTALKNPPEKRSLLPFLRPGWNHYSASNTFLSRLKKGLFSLSTALHGEQRAFIDSAIYDRVMPLHISSVALVKAILAKDIERAQELGLLEVVPEDFALAAFVCPSKIEIVKVIEEGLAILAHDILPSPASQETEQGGIS